MTGAERRAARVRQRCEVYRHLYGTDAHTVEGMRARATLWKITGRKPSLAAFEAALAALQEFRRIADNCIGLWHDGREVWPNDADYDEAQVQALKNQQHTINATMQALLGDNTP